MSFLFSRNAVLTIGKKSGKAKRFSGLRINFNIEKNDEKTPNQAEINIYNLSSASRNFLDNNSDFCILEVGYRNILGTLFIGNDLKLEHSKQGLDIITKIKAGDSQKEIKAKHAELSYKKGTNLLSIVDNLISSLGVATANDKYKAKLKDIKITSSYADSGNAKDILTRLMEKKGFKVNIQDGELFIESEINDGKTKNKTILTYETGLIAINKKKDGLEVLSFIQPSIKPNNYIELITDEYKNSVYKIKQVFYAGDTHEGKWEAKIIV
ncbi:MAG: hypothetical protein GY817_04680 [bacterium]|nr:hypothetical protein [bacterium]